MGQGQLGHLFGHEGVEHTSPKVSRKLPCGLSRQRGSIPCVLPARCWRAPWAKCATGGPPRPPVVCFRLEKKQVVGDQIAISFLVRLVFHLPTDLSKRSGYPVLHQSGLRFGWKLVCRVGGHFPRIRWPLGYGPIIRLPYGPPYLHSGDPSRIFPFCVSSPWRKSNES